MTLFDRFHLVLKTLLKTCRNIFCAERPVVELFCLGLFSLSKGNVAAGHKIVEIPDTAAFPVASPVEVGKRFFGVGKFFLLGKYPCLGKAGVQIGMETSVRSYPDDLIGIFYCRCSVFILPCGMDEGIECQNFDRVV